MSMNVSGISTGEYQHTASRQFSTSSVARGLPIWIFIAACMAGDFLIVATIALRAHPFSSDPIRLSPFNVIASLVLAIACHFIYQQGKLYDIRTLRDGLRCIGQIVLRWGLLCILILASAAIAHTENPLRYYHLFLFFVVGLAGFSLCRMIIGQAIRFCIARGEFIQSVVIIGDYTTTDSIIDKLGPPRSGIHVSGVFPETICPLEISSSPEDSRLLLDFIAEDNIDTVIISIPEITPARLSTLLQVLRKHPLNIYATPETLSLPKISCGWLRQGAFPQLNLIPLASCPNNKAALLIKNIFDRLVAFLILLAASPIMLFCVVGIALSDRGPIFFRQKRIGYKGREFFILKFRTMYVAPQPNTALTEQNDPRIFRFGGLLRKTSLDELPQIFNVLRGDMSLVGPRPHMPEATAAGVLYFEAVGDYPARHRVKPGITGWAQVNGWRGPTETIDQIESRVAHDVYYIENWSLVLDFMILLKTAFVLAGKNVF